MIFLLKKSRGSQGSPADHRSESRLSIPRRGALQRSSSPLPQPSSILKRTAENVENNSANGKCSILLDCLSFGVHRILLRVVPENGQFPQISVQSGGSGGLQSGIVSVHETALPREHRSPQRIFTDT